MTRALIAEGQRIVERLRAGFGVKAVTSNFLPTMVALLTGYAEALDDMEAAEQNMLGMLDATFSVGDGTAQREIERLRAENDRARNAAAVATEGHEGDPAEVIEWLVANLDASRAENERLTAHAGIVEFQRDAFHDQLTAARAELVKWQSPCADVGSTPSGWICPTCKDPNCGDA